MAVHWFKKYFIPHEHNRHQPHLLRARAIIVLFAVIIATEATFLYATFAPHPASSLFSQILPTVLAESTNNDRAARNEPQLTTNQLLVNAAQMKANDMAAKGYFAHVSPEGITPWYWIQKAGYQYAAAGENLAVNYIDSRDVHNAWMNSPTHRDNILNVAYTEIGIATATGMYQGSEAVFVVQMFGAPKKKPAPTPIAAIQTPVPTKIPPTPAKTTVPAPVTKTPQPTLTAERDTSGPVLGLNVARASVTDKVIASPRVLTGTVLQIILGAVALALFLSLGVWMKVRHPRLVVNGVAVIVVISILLIANHYLATFSASIL